MSENRFEKQMQQQMEELKFRPSDAVWEKVEADLQKKKRRRVFFYFSLLAVISLIGGGYYLSQNKTAPSAAGYTVENKTALSTENNHVDSVASNNDTKVENDLTAVKTTTGNALRKSDQPLQIDGTGNRNPTGSSVASADSRSGIVKRRQQVRDLKVKSIVKSNSDALVFEEVAADLSSKTPQISRPEAESHETALPVKRNILRPDFEPHENIAADLYAVKALPLPIDPTISIIDRPIAENSIAAASTKKKISWSIDAGIGLSNRANNSLPDFINRDKAEYLYTGNLGLPAPPQLNRPSSVKSGAAFKIGVAANLSLTKRSSVSAGVQYAFYSDRIRTAGYRDTSFVVTNAISNRYNIRALYPVADEKNYTNHYHFIQVPIRYHLQLGRSPISWKISAVPGYLFNTNALIYDTVANGAYYRDKKALSKFHFNVATGFSFRFGNEKKLHFAVGPDVSFDMTRLINNIYDPKQFLWYGGLSLQLRLPTRK